MPEKKKGDGDEYDDNIACLTFNGIPLPLDNRTSDASYSAMRSKIGDYCLSVD